MFYKCFPMFSWYRQTLCSICVIEIGFDTPTFSSSVNVFLRAGSYMKKRALKPAVHQRGFPCTLPASLSPRSKWTMMRAPPNSLHPNPLLVQTLHEE